MQRNMSAKDYFNSGLSHNKLGQHALAIQDLTNSIELEPNHAESYFNRGRIYSGIGQYALAIQDFIKVVEMKPDRIEPYINLGNCYARQNEYNLAIENYKLVIELDPGFEPTHTNLGNCYARQNEYNLAIENYKRATELNPGSVSNYYNCGLAYKGLGRYAEAIASYTKALDLKEDYGLAFKSLEKLLSGIKMDDDLSKITKPDLFHAIKKLPNIEDQKRLLKQCLDKNTPLGSRMWKPQNAILGFLGFFGVDVNPENYESLKCNYDKGTLRNICEYLETIDNTFVPPYKITNHLDIGLNEENETINSIHNSL